MCSSSSTFHSLNAGSRSSVDRAKPSEGLGRRFKSFREHHGVDSLGIPDLAATVKIGGQTMTKNQTCGLCKNNKATDCTNCQGSGYLFAGPCAWCNGYGALCKTCAAPK